MNEPKGGEGMPMLRSLKGLEGYAVSATDGYIGSVANFLVDDERWVIRYLVVETGGFFSGRRVLISPVSFRQVHWRSTLGFDLALTMDKVKNSPSIDVDKPVSRRHELDWFDYYGYSHYWGPGLRTTGRSNEAPAVQSEEQPGDVHLRSAKEIRGYHIEGTDAAIGHVDDFIIDDETWEVRYLVIDTANWWPGKQVLVAPRWASRISWAEKKVFVDLSRQAIRNSPDWNPSAPVDREYEARLYDHYGRPVYWNSSDRAAQTPPTNQHAGSHAR